MKKAYIILATYKDDPDTNEVLAVRGTLKKAQEVIKNAMFEAAMDMATVFDTTNLHDIVYEIIPAEIDLDELNEEA